MPHPVPYIVDFAARAGYRYEPDPDERWLRVWEPFVTLKTPIRYEHALHATGTTAAVSIARFVLEPRPGYAVSDEAWIVIAQDERLNGRVAASSDAGPLFRDTVVGLPRRLTGDDAFDRVFSSYAENEEALAQAITPSLRKLTLGWQLPLHFEIRPGGFILAPVSLGPDPRSLAWIMQAVPLFGEKAAKHKA